MADGYWNLQTQQHLSAGLPKRPRSDYDILPAVGPSSHEALNYQPRDDYRSGSQVVQDTQSIGSAYDRYLQSMQRSSFSTGEASGNFGGRARLSRGIGGMSGAPPIGEPPRMGGHGATGADVAPNGRDAGFGGQLHVEPTGRPGREVLPLPPDASNTLFVEGLPSDSTQREVAHIFRPFVGFKEVRLVSKESKHRGGDPLILCFVDFMNAACAATALTALQGYRMDEHESEPHILRLQFARFSGPRSGLASRGKR